MPPTTPSIEWFDAMQVYFQGEKIEALVFILPIGLLSLAFSAWLLTDSPSSYAKGVAIPFLLMGLLMSSVGAVVGYRTPSQVAVLTKSLQANPRAALQTEVQRMAKVNSAWSRYLLLWGLFGVAGLLLRFVTSSEFFQGMGIALVFFAGAGLLVDGFAERRTHPYMTELQAKFSKLETSP